MKASGLVLGALCIAAIGTAGIEASRADVAPSDSDKAFVAMVSQGGMFEVKVGQLGTEKGSTQDIKDQATTEVHDHQLVGDKLTSIAGGAGIKLQEGLNANFQKQLDALNALAGTAFDAQYLKDMQDIHAKDGAAFANEAKTGSNAALKDFAAETHRIVVRHIGELTAEGPQSLSH